jgi:predicted KAP-like P-loop ATPase
VPELFPIYFRLTLAAGALSRNDMTNLLSLAATPAALADALVKTTNEKRINGLSKARSVLERLMDYVESEIQDEHLATFIRVLLDIGDALVLRSDRQIGLADFGNESRVTRVVYHLLKRVDAAARLPLLREAFHQGDAIGVQRYCLSALLEEESKAANGGPTALFDAAGLTELKVIWLEKVRAAGDALLGRDEVSGILAAWRQWGNEAEVRTWCAHAAVTTEGLMKLLYSFSQRTTAHTMGDWAVRVQLRLNPAWLERYLDTNACAQRLRALQTGKQIAGADRPIVDQYLKEFDMLRAGKNPDGLFAFED